MHVRCQLQKQDDTAWRGARLKFLFLDSLITMLPCSRAAAVLQWCYSGAAVVLGLKGSSRSSAAEPLLTLLSCCRSGRF